MNGKKGLSRFMSALLAASSMIGGVSARRKKVVKKANSAGVVLDSGNKKKVPLPAESGAVEWIKGHPKTSAGLGLAGLGAIGCGGYIGYKIYNNELNSMYRKMFSEQNCKDFLDFSWYDVGYDSKQKVFIFSKSVEFNKGKKVYCGFMLDAGDIDSLSCGHGSNYEKVLERLKQFLRLWILIYSCERMVKVHPEWSYLFSDGMQFSVRQSVGDSDLKKSAEGGMKNFSHDSKEFRDLGKICKWAEVFARFESEYIVPLLKYVKGYAERNNISIVERIGSLAGRCKKARADNVAHHAPA